MPLDLSKLPTQPGKGESSSPSSLDLSSLPTQPTSGEDGGEQKPGMVETIRQLFTPESMAKGARALAKATAESGIPTSIEVAKQQGSIVAGKAGLSRIIEDLGGKVDVAAEPVIEEHVDKPVRKGLKLLQQIIRNRDIVLPPAMDALVQSIGPENLEKAEPIITETGTMLIGGAVRPFFKPSDMQIAIGMEGIAGTVAAGLGRITKLRAAGKLREARQVAEEVNGLLRIQEKNSKNIPTELGALASYRRRLERINQKKGSIDPSRFKEVRILSPEKTAPTPPRGVEGVRREIRLPQDITLAEPMEYFTRLQRENGPRQVKIKIGSEAHQKLADLARGKRSVGPGIGQNIDIIPLKGQKNYVTFEVPDPKPILTKQIESFRGGGVVSEADRLATRSSVTRGEKVSNKPILLPKETELLPSAIDLALEKVPLQRSGPKEPLIKPFKSSAREGSRVKFGETPEPQRSSLEVKKNPRTGEKEYRAAIPKQEATVVEVEPGKFSVYVRDVVDGADRGYIDRYADLRSHPSLEISPTHENIGGRYTKSYVDARLLDGKTGGRSQLLLRDMDDILKPIRNYDERQILNTIYSNRNFADLDRTGRTTSGVTADIAEARLAALKDQIGVDKFERIGKVADDLAKLQNEKVLDYMVEEGYWSRETADRLKETFPNYMRSEVADELLNEVHPADGFLTETGSTIGRINETFKKRKDGTSLQINTDVVDVIRRSMLQKVAAVEKRAVINRIAEQFGRPLRETVYKGRRLVESRSKTTSGEKFKVHQEIEKLLEGLNVQDVDMITKAVSTVNRIFRLGATGQRLSFAVFNPQRDIWNMLFNRRRVPGDKNVIHSLYRGAVESVMDTFGARRPVVEAWMRDGGPYGGLVTSINRQHPIPFRMVTTKEKLTRGFRRSVLMPLEGVEKMVQIGENAVRLSEYIRLENTKLPRELRALTSRDITVDFQKYGDHMRIVNKWVPFLNANLQGNINSLRALRDQPVISTMRLMNYAVLPTIALRMWNQKFENDKYVDPYIRRTFWYINTGAEMVSNGVKVPVLRIVRKGDSFEGISAVTDFIMDMASEDPLAKAKLEKFGAAGMAAGILASQLPPIIRGPVESVANVKFFTMTPVEPRRLQNVEPGRRFTDTTPNVYRLLGEKLGFISPLRLEHAFGSIYPASSQAAEAADIALEQLNIKPDIPRRTDISALRRMSQFSSTTRIPSGFYVPEQVAARQFKADKDRKRFTPKFLFEQAYWNYLMDNTREDYERMVKFAEPLEGRDYKEVVGRMNKKYNTLFLEDIEKAKRLLPRRYRGEFLEQFLTERK